MHTSSDFERDVQARQHANRAKKVQSEASRLVAQGMDEPSALVAAEAAIPPIDLQGVTGREARQWRLSKQHQWEESAEEMRRLSGE